MKTHHTIPTILLATAAMLNGCASSLAVDAAAGNRIAMPDPVAAMALLASADDLDDAPLVVLPPAPKWPRTLQPNGSNYVMVQFVPYVGQFGVLADYDRADTGQGMSISAGRRIPLAGGTALGIEIDYETSDHFSPSSGVDAAATRLAVAARLSMKMDTKVIPFALAGGGIYALDYEVLDPRYDLSGLGIVLGGGTDFVPTPALTLRVELVAHIWAAAEESGSGGTATTLCLGFGVGSSF